jgi:hypothetical protein
LPLLKLEDDSDRAEAKDTYDVAADVTGGRFAEQVGDFPATTEETRSFRPECRSFMIMILPSWAQSWIVLCF